MYLITLTGLWKQKMYCNGSAISFICWIKLGTMCSFLSFSVHTWNSDEWTREDAKRRNHSTGNRNELQQRTLPGNARNVYVNLVRNSTGPWHSKALYSIICHPFLSYFLPPRCSCLRIKYKTICLLICSPFHIYWWFAQYDFMKMFSFNFNIFTLLCIIYKLN